jgi:hypothetical protein
MTARTHKYCKCCQDYLPLHLFYKDRHSHDGHQGACKDCQLLRHHGRKGMQINDLLRRWKR